MKISVIIPAYNAELTISKCIDSLVNQTYDNLEIIIVNDGSVDNTKKICMEYANKDRRIKFIDNDNHGVSYTRNYGVLNSTGDYITFVDSDDYLDLDCFELLSKYLDDEIEFLRYNFRNDGPKTFNNDLYTLSNEKVVLNNDTRRLLFKHFLTFKEPIPNLVMLLLIRRDVALKLSFNEKLTMMEDVDYYLQLFLNTNVGFFCDEKLYNYYVNSESVTHSSKNYKKNILGILNTNYYIIDKCTDEILVDFVESINANHLRIISNYLIKIYCDDIKNYDNTINELMVNERFLILLNRYYSFEMPLKNGIYLWLLKKNRLGLIKMYLFLLHKLLYIKNALLKK